MMDAELQCFMALDALGLEMLPGETALDAVLRNLALVDTVVRPYRYPQAEGMRHAYQAWIDLGGVRALQGCETADTLNTFQAGYTARGEQS